MRTAGRPLVNTTSCHFPSLGAGLATKGGSGAGTGLCGTAAALAVSYSPAAVGMPPASDPPSFGLLSWYWACSTSQPPPTGPPAPAPLPVPAPPRPVVPAPPAPPPVSPRPRPLVGLLVGQGTLRSASTTRSSTASPVSTWVRVVPTAPTVTRTLLCLPACTTRTRCAAPVVETAEVGTATAPATWDSTIETRAPESR